MEVLGCGVMQQSILEGNAQVRLKIVFFPCSHVRLFVGVCKHVPAVESWQAVDTTTRCVHASCVHLTISADFTCRLHVPFVLAQLCVVSSHVHQPVY